MIAALMEQKYKNGRQLNPVEIANMMIALLMAVSAYEQCYSCGLSCGWRVGQRLIEELYAERSRCMVKARG